MKSDWSLLTSSPPAPHFYVRVVSRPCVPRLVGFGFDNVTILFEQFFGGFLGYCDCTIIGSTERGRESGQGNMRKWSYVVLKRLLI